MENSNGDINNNSSDENPNANPPAVIAETVERGEEQTAAPAPAPAAVNPQSTRTPFSNLSQIDADLALARTLQEQERAYMMLRMNADGSDYESWEGGSYFQEDDEDFDDVSSEEYDGSDVEEDNNADDDINDIGGGDDDEDGDDDDEDGDDDDDEEEDDLEDDEEDEDVFDVHAHEEADGGVELDPASFPNDEAYARALQDAEDREMAARLFALAGLNGQHRALQDADDREMAARLFALAGFNGRHDENMNNHADISQDAWNEVDPDELSYEELIALGEVVGTESRGLSADMISLLPSISYQKQKAQDATNDSCVICRLDYEDDDTLTVLSCKHSYHSGCINNWLIINKVCPICSTEVSTSGKN